MAEVLPNNGLQSALEAPLSAGGTTLQIKPADAARWNHAGEFRAIIAEDPVNGPWELVRVTGGQGTDTLTVTRAVEAYNGDQAARPWSAGAAIAAVITKASLPLAVGTNDPLIVNNATVNQVLTVGQRADIGVAAAAGANTIVCAYAGGNTSGDQVGYHLYSKAGTLRAELWTDAANAETRLKSNGALYFHAGAGSTGFTATNQRLAIAAGGAVTIPGTLGVTGSVTAGALFSGDINTNRGNTTGYIFFGTGNEGYIGHDGTVLYANKAVSVNGALSVSATLGVAGAVTSGGHLTAASTMGVAGKATFTGNAGGLVISNGGGSANVEVQSNPGTGAAMIGLHRPGYYAVNFGLDTDNYLKVGGWSMGAVAYRILDSSQASESAAGSSIVRRDASGYIRGTYINMSADINTGSAPAYVAGQNGDGYLRWYSKSLVGPKPLWYSHPGINQGTSGTQMVGSAVTAPYTGYYFVSAWLRTTTAGSNQWYVRLDIPGYGTVVNGASDWLEGNGRHFRVCDWLGVMSAGQQIYAVSVLLGGTAGSISVTGNLYVNFMPTDGYPG